MNNNLYYELKSIEFSAHREHINTHNKVKHDALEYLYTELREVVDEMYEKIRGLDPAFLIECEATQCIEVTTEVITKTIEYTSGLIIDTNDINIQDDLSTIVGVLKKYLYLDSMS